MTTTESLKRKPNLGIRRTLTLDDGTRIDMIGMSVRKQMEITNNKSMPKADQGMHLLAAQLLVDGKTIVYEDLMDCFAADELEQITELVYPDYKKEAAWMDAKNG